MPRFRGCLRHLQEKCAEANLQVLGKLLASTLRDVSKHIAYREAADKASELSRCLQAELESKFFFFVPSDRADYTALWDGNEIELGKELRRFEPIVAKFPSVSFDIREAGNA